MPIFITDKLLEDIKNKIRIENFMTSPGIHMSGNKCKTKCFCHSEKTPSLIIDLEKNKAQCYGGGCDLNQGKWLDSLAVQQIMDGKGVEPLKGEGFKLYIEELVKRFDIPVEHVSKNNSREKIFRINQYYAQKWHQDLLAGKTDESKKALDYLINKRGLDINDIKEWKLGLLTPDRGQYYDFLNDKSNKIFTSDLIEAGIFKSYGISVCEQEHDARKFQQIHLINKKFALVNDQKGFFKVPTDSLSADVINKANNHFQERNRYVPCFNDVPRITFPISGSNE